MFYATRQAQFFPCSKCIKNIIILCKIKRFWWPCLISNRCACAAAPDSQLKCDENHLKLTADRIWMLLYIRNQELFGMFQKFVLFGAPPRAMSCIFHLLLRELSNVGMSVLHLASSHLHRWNMTWRKKTWLLLKHRWDNGRSHLTQPLMLF